LVFWQWFDHGGLLQQSVHNTRRQAVQYLGRELGGDFIVIGAPDHPLLLRPADVIVGGRANLTAIFTPTVQELRRPEYFQARVTLNMMALPPNTKFVFVGSEMPKSSSDQRFAAEISLEDRGWTLDLLKILSQPGTHRRLKEATFLQRRAESRFAETYRLARVLQRKGRKSLPKESSPRDNRPRYDRIHNNIDAAFFSGTVSSEAVAQISLKNAHRWYADFDGEPGPTQSPASAIFADSYPQRAGDPNKVLRAAAFAGWVISPTLILSLDEVGELVERYTSLK
jgi:hypothetical protein